MLALNFGDWVFWEEYDPPRYLGSQKVTFDGPNKLILVNHGELELDYRVDVYSAWKEWLKDPNHINTKYAFALSVTGGDPLPGDRKLGTTYFLENGWKMRTWEGDHELTVNGNFFTRDGSSAFVSTLMPWTITVNLNTSTLVETIVPETSISEGDIESISDGVWDEVIDVPKDQTARDKLKKIATKAQDIALA